MECKMREGKRDKGWCRVKGQKGREEERGETVRWVLGGKRRDEGEGWRGWCRPVGYAIRRRERRDDGGWWGGADGCMIRKKQERWRCRNGRVGVG